MKVVIVAKTRMGSGACVGGLTFEGRSLRLIAADRETNDRFNMEFQVGEVWEIEANEDPDIIPPHIENVIVTRKHRLGLVNQITMFIEQQMSPLFGGVEVLFGGLTQTTKVGSLYIAKRSGIPARSTMFWVPDRPLRRVDDLKRIRYCYPTADGGPTLTFTGFQEPLSEIPAGTLLRVSLAHWWRPSDMLEGELRCYIQLSGWFIDESNFKPGIEMPTHVQKQTCETRIPEIQERLHQVFGYSQFRSQQRKIIENVLRKQDTLAVMPTGSGKSLCYQLPATLFSGLTVVVSPLISLMEDQVLELGELGIAADYLNSTLTHGEYMAVVARLKSGETKLLYAAPETLLRPETIVLLENCPVDCLVIDEAHCISEWGHDFRPEYRQLDGLRVRLYEAVTLAVTATATKRVRQDIKGSIGIATANEFISSFDRENLVLSVDDKINGLMQTRTFLDSHVDQAGIIYCATRDQVDGLSTQLGGLGYPVLPYHAGLEDGTRRRHQHRFRYEDGIIMVATIAFGMGINKPNVRFVLHYDLPKNLESYYQQIGRAGRDGLSADCLVLFSYSDVATIRFFIKQEYPKRRRGSEQRLNAFLTYLDTQTCRRVPLLAYFGERYSRDSCEVACDNCINQSPERAHPSEEGDSEKVDLTTTAQQFITCAQETSEIFGTIHLIEVLRGSKAKKVLQKKHDLLSTYGVGRDYTKEQWRHLAGQFIRQNLLVRTKSHGSLKVTEDGKAVLEGKCIWGTIPGTFTQTRAAPVDGEYDLKLFEQLRALRAVLASERNLPPYVIFHDRSLIEMATYFPNNIESLGQIYGVGQHKIKQYGLHFLPIIREHCKENSLQPKIPKQALKRVLPAGQRRTEAIWEQFQAGQSVSDIASEFGFTPSTILNHLKKAWDSGRPLRMDGLKEMSVLSQNDAQRVLDAFSEFGTPRLKRIFDALDQTVPFEQLHLWRLIYKARKCEDKPSG
jgi:ATP-dependent DNA helicase RecQ